MMDIIKVIENTIIEHNLINENDRILVALSGGSDSVTLLRTLYKLKDKYSFTISAAHINHSLRDTATRDMNFCKELCDELNIQLHILIRDIKKESKEHKMSEELYAREVRYEYFDSLGYDKIATAHNKNDNAETILFNMMRGSSLSGLCGIPYKRNNIIRPLLDLEKSDIVRFCNQNNYSFVTDETNLIPKYTRNKIRLDLIPKIENDYNKSFVNVITSNCKLLKEDSDYLNNIAKANYHGEIKSAYMKEIDIAILRRMIELHFKNSTNSTKNLSKSYLDNILELLNKNETGSKIDLPNGFEAYLSYGKLIIDKKTEEVYYEYKIIPDTPLYIPEIEKIILLSSNENGDIFLENTNDLIIRSKKTGDYFFPVGMDGKKKLSDFFTDKKIPNRKRAYIPLLTKDNQIVSIIGYRNDRRFQNKTNKCYKIIVKEASNA